MTDTSNSHTNDTDFGSIKTVGTSGGTVTCDPSNNNYLGTEDQEITCIATGRNGLETTVTFQVKREQ